MIRTEGRMRLCLTLILLILVFIWGNSMLPGEISQKISDTVEALLRSVCSEGLQTWLDDWFLNDIPNPSGGGWLRKAAHFTEFAGLGMCLAWLFGMLKRPVCRSAVWGFLAACIDEGIQMFTPDRGPSLADVWIDTSGAVTGMMLLILGQYLWKKNKTKM